MKALVVSGTLGAGKTFAAAAIRDALAARGERVAVIDLDWLCQCDPAPVQDPYNDALAFANLASVYPNYVAAGVDYLVLARVVADLHDRARYETALPGAQLQIVLLTASSAERRDRIVSREPAGPWRDGHLARTDIVADALEVLAVEDLKVTTDGRLGSEIANEILAGLGW
jgi:adenylylsulfate kinase